MGFSFILKSAVALAIEWGKSAELEHAIKLLFCRRFYKDLHAKEPELKRKQKETIASGKILS